ncbi:hypothetical protein Calow_1409 [Caldicellulosiruptor owensensis OL]|uniref:Uncharacterized protein n=1 Tax=Caldicellulosiruptor owensensis (strain ATCC 700167 / DSM 13100 / OL) TaxID=632518 RepID=E4Q2U0_CALOW|nr:hypothetical protein [Caldicellulosiruptor owensensis]ADQ04958.1 hypothetical protein Calow_1409 [Caldicellulosiruptor owensensis OL]
MIISILIIQWTQFYFNFLHPEGRGSQRTEVDLFAVRFPYREEIGMQDYKIFLREKTQLFIVEVKSTDKIKEFNDATKNNLEKI